MHDFGYDHDDAIFIRFALSTSFRRTTKWLACFHAAEKREST